MLARSARDDALPDGLTRRVLADAARLQDARRAANAASGRRRRFGWRFNWPTLGGAGGLVAASCVGFWIGASAPQMLPDPAAVLLGAEIGDSAEETAEVFAFGWDIEDG